MVRCRFAAVHHRARKPRCSPACEARHRLVQASIGWENPKEGASTSPSSPKRGTPQKSSQLRCLAAAQCNGEKKGAKGQLDWGVRLPQSGRRKSQGGFASRLPPRSQMRLPSLCLGHSRQQKKGSKQQGETGQEGRHLQMGGLGRPASPKASKTGVVNRAVCLRVASGVASL